MTTMQTIYLEANLVPSQLRNGYSGKKFKAVVCESMTIHADADLWSGGSRDRYQGIELATGRTSAPASFNLAPWDNARDETEITLRQGYGIVRHSIFCGKDMGLTFYVHPTDAVALLPAPSAELSAHEKIVLNATASYKSSYNGQDRYQMAMPYGDKSGYPTRAQWDDAKTLLISKGLLNKAGAITVAGRNAR